MPYDPKAYDKDDRSFSLNMTWVTAITSVLFLIGTVFGQQEFWVNWCAAITAGAFIGVPLSWMLDDYHKSLQAIGLRWAALPVGFWIFTIAFENKIDGWALEPALALAIIGFAYHAGFMTARYRGTFG